MRKKSIVEKFECEYGTFQKNFTDCLCLCVLYKRIILNLNKGLIIAVYYAVYA